MTETRVVFHTDGLRRRPQDVRHAVNGVRVLLEDDGWDVEYRTSGAPWIRESRAVLVLTDVAADYRVVFDLGESDNTTKHWVRVELIRAAISVGGLLDFATDEADERVERAS